MISPIKLAAEELDLKQQAEVLPMAVIAQYEQMYVRPQHATTSKAMTFRDEATNRLPFCSDVLHKWAMDLVMGNHTTLVRMDPLSSPDLLFPMPTRSLPLCYVTPNDVKLLMRPNENQEKAEAFMAAWEALIALFFAMRLSTEHEPINRSPFASYHQHALVSPDALSLIPPENLRGREGDHNPSMTLHGLCLDHKQAEDTTEQWGKEIHACTVRRAAGTEKMTYNCEYSTTSIDARYARLKRLDKTTCGLASTVTLATPTMEAIAGFRTNPGLVMPFYQAYQEVRASIHASLDNKGPVETLRFGLPQDYSDWNEVTFVSEKQVIEELTTS